MSDRETLDSGLPNLIADLLSHIHTVQPGQIVNYDADTNLAEVQPCLKRKYRGQAQATQLPVITDVPVIFPGAGDWWVTFPLAEGDYVLLLFSERSIATWLSQGGIQAPSALRKFALSDAIAVPGILPGPSVLSPGVATDGLEVRNRAKSTIIRCTATEIEIVGATVSLGDASATEPAMQGTKFLTKYNVHSHSTAFGPSGPPAVLFTADDMSTKVKVG